MSYLPPVTPVKVDTGLVIRLQRVLPGMCVGGWSPPGSRIIMGPFDKTDLLSERSPPMTLHPLRRSLPLMLALAVTAALLFGCGSSENQTGTSVEPMAVASAETGNKAPDGKTILATKCAACHRAYQPNELNLMQWRNTLQVMAPRARLTDTETQAVLKYIQSAQKAGKGS